MLRHQRGRAAAIALLCLPAAPALADTATFSLTGSWQKIASAGMSVDVQNNNGAGYAVLSTAAGGAPAGPSGQALGPGEHRLYGLSADLYARGTVTVVVTSGVGVASTGGAPAEASAAAQSLSGLNLLDTVAAGARLGWWFFQNQSSATLYVALDDGAGNALSVFAMAPGAGAGQQGASMGSADTGPHVGRIRVYGPASSQHSLRVQ